jgi:hypothetical protein
MGRHVRLFGADAVVPTKMKHSPSFPRFAVISAWRQYDGSDDCQCARGRPAGH